MGNFFDRFTDLDKLREQAEDLWERSVRETKRQAALGKLRAHLGELQVRMNLEFRRLGHKVWSLHADDALTKKNLTGAFDVLEALADEIAEARAEMNRLTNGEDAPTPEPTPGPDPANESAPDRHVESEHAASAPDAPLE